MIRNGDVIQGYMVLAVANGIVLAESKTAPAPYAVWSIDADCNGVHSGSYMRDREDAEWEFCMRAFPWFEDNAPVNMIEDAEEKHITEFKGYLSAAEKAIRAAAASVEAMVAEHGWLEEKEAPQEERAEQEEPFLVSDVGNRGHRKRHTKKYSFERMLELIEEGYPHITVISKDDETLLFSNHAQIKAENFIIRKGKHSPVSLDVDLEED